MEPTCGGLGRCDTASCKTTKDCAIYKPSRQEFYEKQEALLKLNAVPSLPQDAKARKDIPLARGLLDYFPAALAAVAEMSKKGNDQHNPGEPLHWARGKSMDHADCLMRHLIDRGTPDTDGVSHSVKVAWRALALLQEELEASGAPMPRGARLTTHDNKGD